MPDRDTAPRYACPDCKGDSQLYANLIACYELDEIGNLDICDNDVSADVLELPEDPIVHCGQCGRIGPLEKWEVDHDETYDPVTKTFYPRGRCDTCGKPSPCNQPDHTEAIP